MLFTTAMRGWKKLVQAVALVHFTDENVAVATLALAICEPPSMKFFMSAPFMIVGCLPARCRIQPIMPTVVDSGLVQVDTAHRRRAD